MILQRNKNWDFTFLNESRNIETFRREKSESGTEIEF